MTDNEKSREDLLEELRKLRRQVADQEKMLSDRDHPRRLFHDARDRPPGHSAPASPPGLSPLEATQSIDLSSLFTGDITTSGSFDIRGDIWATTFGRVLQALPIPALMIDDSFRVVAANQAWGRLGVAHEAIRSYPFANFFRDPEAKNNAQHLIEEVFSTRKPRLWQTVMEFNGKKIWGRLTFRSIRVMRERFILTLVENLTREKAQLQANERLRVTLENIVKKRTQALAESNEQLKQEIASRQFAQGELKEAYEKLAHLNTILENRVRDRTVQLETANRELQEEISRRKNVEEALLKSEELHRTIVETALEGIWVMDSELRTTYVNHTMADILGYEVTEMFGRPFTDFLRKDHVGDHERRMERRRAGLRERYERAFVRKDGQEVWALVSATPLQDVSGRFTGSFVMVTDITERQRMENALKEAKETAETANMAKSEFLARMSHEIRTPINGIVGMTELALESDLTSVQRSYLDYVALSADTLIRIIDEILDFSRIEAGKLALESAEFSLRECVFDAMVAPSVQATAKGLEMVGHVAADVPDVVCGDRGRLSQVLVNLVGNAVKFTEQGEVLVQVTVDAIESEAVLLHFCVRDTGVGVSEKDSDRVFEPFEQVEGSSTRKHGGSGLGLAICKNLVNLMRGDIWLDKEASEGTAFHFTVHLGLQEVDRQWPSASAISPLQGVRVLLADDHATARRVLEHQLTSWGMEPSSFESGEAALQALRANVKAGKPFELVLLDATMPGVNGFQVAEAMRADPALRQAGIIMLGFTRRESDDRECDRLGIEDRLSKPVRPSELFKAVTRRFRQQETEQSGQGTKVSDKFASTSRPLRILLVEDNHINRQVADSMLKKMGHSVTLAVHGKEAVSLYQERDFDLILMDVEMPEMDGVEATRIIRKSEKDVKGRIPIVALTAHAMAGHREGFLSAGMDGYVAKPIKYKTLFEAVETYGGSSYPGMRHIPGSMDDA